MGEERRQKEEDEKQKEDGDEHDEDDGIENGRGRSPAVGEESGGGLGPYGW